MSISMGGTLYNTRRQNALSRTYKIKFQTCLLYKIIHRQRLVARNPSEHLYYNTLLEQLIKSEITYKMIEYFICFMLLMINILTDCRLTHT